MGRLDGKVAFITGAARGQGRSHAIRLAQEGADIIALDVCAPIPSVERLYPGASDDDMAETIDKVKQFGGRIVSAKADVRDFDAIAKVVADGVTDFGGIDVVSANAGIFVFGESSHLVSESDWDEALDINLKGVWHTCKAVTPAMIDAGKGGSIVITSSTAGIKGTPNVAPYTASKHAVVGLMKTLALELAPHSIRVNTIHPTGVATDMILNEATFKLFLPDEEHPTKEQAAPVFTTTNALPVPWVEASDISNALLFLASDEARYITGNELKVDAGYCIK
ncbi:mycofactocin-coupled SDR family oxidoreductase [Gordonia sp. HY002]|uniref:mycofactocin-coupled SDR family oxidoreductase n=1 Tax=Gordonia zhenghanii TaxID=2911516 RepID=UPI001EF0B1E7|nr:mycofactocin-coupled SDR family oxidoreductase [Gordonia zhenghanii]MCF8571141.1 mycofactocin-coupled SDR family oxidoreductase [Gordonia zhenghanii]MCF8604651.1 mycofactocin-coupled SDR family oxidoreductase [Gordonia zhenghanii]